MEGFQFKQFTVWHDRCAMKVGTDGVLLGAWADVENAKTILDIGAGSGLIALMTAQRAPNAMIDAIEIDADAFDQATSNVTASPWKERINVYHYSLQEYRAICNTRYDVMVCNPPFFSQSLKSPDDRRTLARHDDTLNNQSILAAAQQLLSPDGVLQLILPLKQGEALIAAAAAFHLWCNRKTCVHPTPQKPPKRVLISLQKKETKCIDTSLSLEIGEQHHRSPEYRELTKEFYLDK